MVMTNILYAYNIQIHNKVAAGLSYKHRYFFIYKNVIESYKLSVDLQV